MTRDKRRERPKERGAAMLELAIAIPMLVLLLFGILEMGLAVYRLQGLHAASRDAARVGSFPTISVGQIEARALASLSSTLLESDPTITIEPSGQYPCADPATEAVVVTIEAIDDVAIPFWDAVAIPLTSRAEFACEN